MHLPGRRVKAMDDGIARLIATWTEPTAGVRVDFPA